MEGEDVFARRKTRNVNYWDVSNSRGAGGASSFVWDLPCVFYYILSKVCVVGQSRPTFQSSSS